MNNPPIKAASKDFYPQPFYLLQTNGDDQRYVVSLRDKTRIRTLIAGFINQAAVVAEVKVRVFDGDEDFVDYAGLVATSKLHELLTKHEEVVFHNGYHDLMVRQPGTEEILVFDEHGLIFLYTAQAYETTLINLQAEYRPDEQLIYEYDHWHYCIADGEEKLLQFIGDLGLQKEL